MGVDPHLTVLAPVDGRELVRDLSRCLQRAADLSLLSALHRRQGRVRSVTGRLPLCTVRPRVHLHPASALHVQEDPTLTPFRIADLGGVAGKVDRDRLSGIRGRVGAGPDTTRVSSTLTGPGGTSRTGRTLIADKRLTPDLAASHVLRNADLVLRAVGPGSAATTLDGQGHPCWWRALHAHAPHARGGPVRRRCGTGPRRLLGEEGPSPEPGGTGPANLDGLLAELARSASARVRGTLQVEGSQARTAQVDLDQAVAPYRIDAPVQVR